jgi:hypothetical protein
MRQSIDASDREILSRFSDADNENLPLQSIDKTQKTSSYRILLRYATLKDYALLATSFFLLQYAR